MTVVVISVGDSDTMSLFSSVGNCDSVGFLVSFTIEGSRDCNGIVEGASEKNFHRLGANVGEGRYFILGTLDFTTASTVLGTIEGD